MPSPLFSGDGDESDANYYPGNTAATKNRVKESIEKIAANVQEIVVTKDPKKRDELQQEAQQMLDQNAKDLAAGRKRAKDAKKLKKRVSFVLPDSPMVSAAPDKQMNSDQKELLAARMNELATK